MPETPAPLDFTAFNASRLEELGEPVPVTLNGKTYTAVPGREFTGDKLLNAALAIDDIGFTNSMLYAAFGEKQYRELLAACADKKKPVVMATLTEIARQLVLVYTGRPTGPSPSTTPGQGSDGDGSESGSPQPASDKSPAAG